MSRLVQDIETLLDQLIVEHRKLLACVDQHTAAMKAMDISAMSQLARQQEACRSRIGQLDHRRRGLIQQIMRQHKLTSEPTLSKLAELFPMSAAVLRGKRDVLRTLAGDIALRSNVSSKLAAAVLGHLNTAVRLISSAVQHAGVYTKSGIPRVAGRIGAMEAVA